jgi:hypothetical protein
MVDARIPIELKIADKPNWTANALKERLENQLIGQYMREAHYGVLLLVRRGAQYDRNQWSIPGKDNADFADLLAWLSTEAGSLVAQHREVKALQVVGIDLTARATAHPALPRAKPSTRAGKNKAPTPARRAQSRTVRHGK